MTRYSFTRRVIRPQTIPDPDCPHSYFKNCRFVGDFSAYDWRDCDFIDCDLTGVTALPSGDKLDYIYSRNSNWECGVLPEDIPTTSHDIANGWWVQHIASWTGQERAVAQKLRDSNAGQYLRSWPNHYDVVMSQFSMSQNGARDYVALNLFPNAPRLKGRLVEAAKQTPSTQLLQQQDLTKIRVSSAPKGERLVDVSGEIIPTDDRWVLARHLESLHPDLRFWVAWISPLMYILACHRQVHFAPDYEDWWFTAMWVA